MATELAFLLTGVIVVIGFAGDYLFRKTSVPDILILILLGFLVGPLTGLVEPSQLSSVTPILSSLALVVILFDGGLNLDIFKVLKEAPRSLVLAVTGTVLSMLVIMVVVHFLLGWGILSGLLLGVILGGTSSSIVVPIISRAKVSGKTSIVLSLESTFTDALVVVLGLVLLQILETASATTPTESVILTALSGIVARFSIGIVIGLVIGLIWLRVLRYIRGQQYDDILTLSVVLLFFAIVETLGGNGAIFALTFGLVLGNGRAISNMIRSNETMEATSIMKKFQSEISFIIRIFFFVYLGLIISGNNLYLFGIGILLTSILLGARYLAVRLSTIRDQELAEVKWVLTTMLPRGLAAAVIAQIVSTSGIVNASSYLGIVIPVIILSVILSSVGFFLWGRKSKGIMTRTA